MNKLCKWLSINRSSLTIMKTKCIVFHNKKINNVVPHVNLNNTLIKRVHSLTGIEPYTLDQC